MIIIYQSAKQINKQNIMSKVCSIIPQVANSTGTVDSKLFTEINESLKSQFQGVELREKTKSVFKAYHSPDFKSIVGDYELYNSVINNTMSKAQKSKFNTLYKGDITRLEKSISKSLLNELNEPITISTDERLPNSVTNIGEVSNVDIMFNDVSNIDELAISLNTTRNSLINHILSTGKNIYIKSLNTVYTYETLENRQAPRSLSIAAVYGYGAELNSDKTNFNFDNPNIHNMDVLSSNYTDAEFMFMNKIISALVIDDYDNFDELLSKVDEKLSNYKQVQLLSNFIKSKINNYKNSIVEAIDKQIEKAVDPVTINNLKNNRNRIIFEYDKYIETLFTEEKGKLSFAYRTLISHLRKSYGIDITNVSGLFEVESTDSEGNTYHEEFVKAEWDSRKAMSINRLKNVAKDLKFKIAQCVSSEVISNSTNALNPNNKFGINEPLSIDDIWNTCISIAAQTNDFSTIIKKLRVIDNTQYNGVLSSFIDAIQSDKALWNSFFSSVCLVSVPNKTVVMATSLNGEKILLTDKINNYNAFAENKAFGQLKSAIQTKLENNKDYMSNVYGTESTENFTEHMHNPKLPINKHLENSRISGKDDINSIITKKRNWIATRLSNLGIDSYLTLQDIDNTIQVNHASNVEIIENPYLKNTATGLTNLETKIKEIQKDTTIANKEVILKELINLQNVYVSELNKVIEQLIRLTDNLYKVKTEYNKLSNKRKMEYKFNKKFDANKSLKLLASYAVIRNHTNTTQSYYNVNGDMEQTPQYPSYLTDIMNAMQIVGGVIDSERVINYMTDKGYLSDRTFNNNSFIYMFKSFNRIMLSYRK